MPFNLRHRTPQIQRPTNSRRESRSTMARRLGCEILIMQTIPKNTYSRRQTIRIRHGFCVRCGEPRGDDGTKTRCRSCADWMSRSTCQIKSRKVKSKLCRHCSAPLANDYKYRACELCLKVNQEKQKIRLKAREENGLCKNCAKPSGNYKHCFKCRAARREKDNFRYANRTAEQIERDRARWSKRNKK